MNALCDYRALRAKSIFLIDLGHTCVLRLWQMLAAVTSYVGVGPYFANGDEFEGVASNFNGHWGGA